MRAPFGGIGRGALYAPEDGGYVLTLESDDGSALYLDSQPAIDHWRRNSPARKVTMILMRRGFHRLALHLYSGRLRFFWAPPGVPLENVPSEYLFNR